MSILSVVNAALEQTAFEVNPNQYIVSGVAMLLQQLYGDLEQALRTCIHKRLSRVWKWEITTIDSAEETEIS